MMEECFNIFQRYFLHFHNSSERTSGRLCGNWQEEWKITFFTDLQAGWIEGKFTESGAWIFSVQRDQSLFVAIYFPIYIFLRLESFHRLSLSATITSCWLPHLLLLLDLCAIGFHRLLLHLVVVNLPSWRCSMGREPVARGVRVEKGGACVLPNAQHWERLGK